MHPSTALIVWLASVLSVQFLGYAGLGLLGFAMLISSISVYRSWLNYLRRARWLLLTLWLILAYNTPGDALLDWTWAPTEQGVAEASLQALRLVVILGCLAWLFLRLGQEGLISALWGLLQPLRRLGLDTQRLVVRLSLVMTNLQVPQEKGDWKKMLAGDAAFVGGPDVMQLSLPSWQLIDTLVVISAGLVLVGIILV